MGYRPFLAYAKGSRSGKRDLNSEFYNSSDIKMIPLTMSLKIIQARYFPYRLDYDSWKVNWLSNLKIILIEG